MSSPSIGESDKSSTPEEVYQLNNHGGLLHKIEST